MSSPQSTSICYWRQLDLNFLPTKAEHKVVYAGYEALWRKNSPKDQYFIYHCSGKIAEVSKENQRLS